MAPRSKFTRQELIDASFKIVRERGSDALTAKAIADELHISTRPIFTCFGSMDEVRREVRAAAEALYDRYTAEGFRQRVPFFGFGMQYDSHRLQRFHLQIHQGNSRLRVRRL